MPSEPVGHKLDALVAERVMGWTISGDGSTWTADVGKHGTNECLCERGDFRPSTDIAAAWQVVEKMRVDNFNFEMHIFTIAYGGSALVSFVCSNGPCDLHGHTHHSAHGAFDIEAETAPLAICRAALKAKGVTSAK